MSHFWTAFESLAKRCGDATALRDDHEKISYFDLYQISIDISEKMSEHINFDGNRRVGLLLENSIEAIAIMLACYRSNLTYVPLSTQDSQENLEILFEKADLDILFLNKNKANQLTNLGGRALGVVSFVSGQLNLSFEKAVRIKVSKKVDQDVPLYILFTSGSTGIPKGIAIGKNQLTAFLQGIEQVVQIKPTDVLVNHTRLIFDLSVFDIYLTLSKGACLTLIKKKLDLIFPVDFISKNKATIILLVPSITTFVKKAVDIENPGLNSLRYLLFCGEGLHSEQVLFWKSICPNAILINLYGPTETTVAVSSKVIGQVTAGIQSIGKPFGNNELRVVCKKTGKFIVEAGLSGELIIYGPQVSEFGYVSDNVQGKFFSDSRTGTRCFKTGDQVRLDENLDFIWMGRFDNQVKILGHRVELEEIESLFKKTALVDECVLLKKDNALVLAYEASSRLPTSSLNTELAEFANRNLKSYQIPHSLHRFETLPRTASGKIDRKSISKSLLADL